MIFTTNRGRPHSVRVVDYGADGGFIVSGLPLRAFYTETNRQSEPAVKLPLSIYAHRGPEYIDARSAPRSGTRTELESRQPGNAATLSAPWPFSNVRIQTYVSFPRYIQYRRGSNNRVDSRDPRWVLDGDPLFRTEGEHRGVEYISAAEAALHPGFHNAHRMVV